MRLEDDDANAAPRSSLPSACARSARSSSAASRRSAQKITAGDDLAPGVLKMVKVYLAVKRRVQPGDKMAGRATATRA